MITFSPINTLHSLKQHACSLSAQPVRHKFNYYSKWSKRPSFFIYTSHRSVIPPFVNNIVHNALRLAICHVSIKRCLRSISHVSNWHLIHTILHHAPYSTVNRTKIETIRKPAVRRNEFRISCWSSSTSDVHGVCRTVLPNIIINVSQGSVSAVRR